MKNNNNAPVDFHLVIPCFQESKRLPPYLDSLVNHLSDQQFKTRILVVDDGSGEDEKKKLQEILDQMRSRYAIIMEPVFLEQNCGKGYAVRTGWKAGKDARWLAFADADGATSASEVVRVFTLIHNNNDDGTCYLGSRICMLGRTVDRNWRRHIVGRVYATLVGKTINQPVYDSQCGFKIISGRAFGCIQDVLEENRFAFDSELIAALADTRFRLEEIPVDWQDIAGSKVSIIRDPLKMTTSLFNIQKRRKDWVFKSMNS